MAEEGNGTTTTNIAGYTALALMGYGATRREDESQPASKNTRDNRADHRDETATEKASSRQNFGHIFVRFLTETTPPTLINELHYVWRAPRQTIHTAGKAGVAVAGGLIIYVSVTLVWSAASTSLSPSAARSVDRSLARPLAPPGGAATQI